MLAFLVVAAALVAVDSAAESNVVLVAVSEGRSLLLDCSEGMTSIENTTFIWEDNADITRYFRYWPESDQSLAGNYTCRAGGKETVTFIVTVEYLDNLELDVTPSDTCNVNDVTATCVVHSNAETTLTIHREDTNDTFSVQGQNVSGQFEVQCGQTVRVRCIATSGNRSRVQFKQLDVLCAPEPPAPSITVGNVMNVTSYANPAPVYTWTRTTTMYTVLVSNICGSSKFNLYLKDGQGGTLDVGESIAVGATGCLVVVALVVIATYGVRRLYRHYKEDRARMKLKALSSSRGRPRQAAAMSSTGDMYEEIGENKQVVERVEYDLVDGDFSERHSQKRKQLKYRPGKQKGHKSEQREDFIAPEPAANTYEEISTIKGGVNNGHGQRAGRRESIETRRANVPATTYEEPVKTVEASVQPDSVYEELQGDSKADGTGSLRGKYVEAEPEGTDPHPDIREVKPPVPSRKNLQKSTSSVTQTSIGPGHLVESDDGTRLPTVPTRHWMQSEGNTYEELSSEHRSQQSDSQRPSDTGSNHSGYEMLPDEDTLRKLRQRAQKRAQKRALRDSQPNQKRPLFGWKAKKAKVNARKQTCAEVNDTIPVYGASGQDGQGHRTERSNAKRYIKDDNSAKASDDLMYMNQDEGDATQPADTDMSNNVPVTQAYEDMTMDVKSSRRKKSSPPECEDQKHFQKVLESSETGFYANTG